MSVPKSATRRADEGGLRPFTSPPRGGLLPPEAAAIALADALLGKGAVYFAAGAGLLPPAVAAFALPAPFLPRAWDPRS